jgi:hypothetical protein
MNKPLSPRQRAQKAIAPWQQANATAIPFGTVVMLLEQEIAAVVLHVQKRMRRRGQA